MTNNTDAAYEAHMQKVDAILLRKVGLTHQDGEDTATRDRFDDGFTPASHAAAILEDWGWEG
jgi:hypothetical protein